MLTTIHLGGPLGRRFGREWKLDLDVPSPAEAVRALCAVSKGFRAWVLQHSRPGYHVFAGRRSLRDAEELADPTGRADITIMPALAGAKDGVLGVIIGAVLIAAGVAAHFIPGLGAATPFLINAGIALALGGVSQLLAGPPPPASTEASDSPQYVFGGPLNTVGVGGPVPVLYGKLEVGSQVVSAGITLRPSTPNNPYAADDPDPNPITSRWHLPHLPNFP